MFAPRYIRQYPTYFLCLYAYCLLLPAVLRAQNPMTGKNLLDKQKAVLQIMPYIPADPSHQYLPLDPRTVPTLPANGALPRPPFAPRQNEQNPTGGLLRQTLRDELGMTHQRYQQTYCDIPIEGAIYIVHADQQGRVIAMNGDWITQPNDAPAQAKWTAEQATQRALDWVAAQKYREYDNTGLVYVPTSPAQTYNNYENATADLRLCYKIDVYATTPLNRQYVFVDANNGDIVMRLDRLCSGNSNGIAQTKYSGTQPIITDSTATNNYRLRETTRGNGVYTYNCQQTTNYTYTDFTDADNLWNTVNAQQDEAANDAHWGAEKTYDYYLNIHNRQSIDDNNMPLESHVHYGVNYFNAFWDGQRMTYGDGNGSATALTCLDIVAHELTHGVTEYSAGLYYINESGALNEAFSDILGTAVEFHTKPATASWLLGNEIGATLRSMSNPNAYGDPDTYLGTNWYIGSSDNGGVHTNSGVANFWFYLLSTGGSGTNDLGNVYNVSGISIENARLIAYRTLAVYLTPTSNYADARFYGIQAAIDLFGACSPQVIATANAWHAVGIGNAYDGNIVADFDANVIAACAAPLTVQFENNSAYAGSYYWDFGDGNTATDISPTHTYLNNGDYTVMLIAITDTCGRDTLIKPNYISIQAANPCIYNMPAAGVAPGAISACAGTLYDAGGMSNNYFDNVSSIMTIAPTNAATLIVDFDIFDLEADYDYLYLYDGINDQAPNIGFYTGNTLPNGGNPIVATSGALTVKLVSDPFVTGAGFRMAWTCTPIIEKPIARFESDVRSTCSGEVQFYDRSTNIPNAWLWDFGDGGTANMRNPKHTYAQNGNYAVSLHATNTFGTDDTLRTAYVSVNRPAAPVVANDTICYNDSTTLTVIGNGVYTWYGSPNDTATVLVEGNNYTTPILIDTTSYYIQETIIPSLQSVGPVNNSIGAGGFFGLSNRYMIFDVLQPCRLQSVRVYANSGFNRTIQLRDSAGLILQDTTLYINNGESIITLNFDLPVANNLRLGTAATSELYRNTDGAAYPYTLPGILSITGNNASANIYYFFYDWKIELPTCISLYKEATVIVKPLPAPIVAGDDEPCPTQTMSYTVDNPNVNSQYQWTITGGVIASGQGTSTVTVIWNDGITSGSIAVTETKP
jgi:Zn-dependent metalloprotease